MRSLLPPKAKADWKKLALRLVLSVVALLALRYNFEVCVGLETDSRIVNILSAFPLAFGINNDTDLLICAAVFMLYTLADAVGIPERRGAAILAAVFSLLHTLANASATALGWRLLWAGTLQLCLTLICLLGYAAVYYPIIRLIFTAMEKCSRREAGLKHPVRLGALIMLACWLPWVVLTYPGSFCTDSIHQLRMWLGIVPFSAHHPPLSTVIMGLCYSFGKMLGSVNFGCFLYLLLQTVLGAVIFSFSLSQLLRCGAPRALWVAGLVFFCISPIWFCSVQWFEKDLLYTEFFVLTFSLLVPVLTERKCSAKTAVYIYASALAAILLRKTGLYELGIGLLAACFWLKSKSRRNLLCASLSVLIICFAVNDALYPALQIRFGSVAEALSIPFQQTAKYCLTYPDEVTPEEKEVIDKTLDYDGLSAYDRRCSDSIKVLYKKDGSVLPDYFKTWLRMFFKHPVNYVETFFETSSAVLNPEDPWIDAVIQIDPEQFEAVIGLGISYPQPESLRKALDCIREISINMPILNLFAMAGFYTWGFALCLTQNIRRRCAPLLLLSVPALMNILICMASPVNASIRYELPLIAMLPMLIGLTAVFSAPDGDKGESDK